MFGVREANIFPLLDCHPTKFSIGSVCKFCTTVQVEEIPKQFNYGLLLKISLAKNLEMTNIGHRIWASVLRVELEARKYISEEF